MNEQKEQKCTMHFFVQNTFNYKLTKNEKGGGV